MTQLYNARILRCPCAMYIIKFLSITLSQTWQCSAPKIGKLQFCLIFKLHPSFSYYSWIHILRLHCDKWHNSEYWDAQSFGCSGVSRLLTWYVLARYLTYILPYFLCFSVQARLRAWQKSDFKISKFNRHVLLFFLFCGQKKCPDIKR